MNNSNFSRVQGGAHLLADGSYGTLFFVFRKGFFQTLENMLSRESPSWKKGAPEKKKQAIRRERRLTASVRTFENASRDGSIDT